jgi:hypothetical protein
MNRPTLPTLAQSESAYALLRIAGQCNFVRQSCDQWFQLPELDAYAKALAGFNLLSTICVDLPDNVGVTDDLARQASIAIAALAEIENRLGALLIVQDAERLVLAAEADAMT